MLAAFCNDILWLSTTRFNLLGHVVRQTLSTLFSLCLPVLTLFGVENTQFSLFATYSNVLIIEIFQASFASVSQIHAIVWLSTVLLVQATFLSASLASKSYISLVLDFSGNLLVPCTVILMVTACQVLPPKQPKPKPEVKAEQPSVEVMPVQPNIQEEPPVAAEIMDN